ncbi:MAG: aldehyde dehydrogenase family protein [Acidobacteria bacterium]|nr:MAG: aldehyde dehydrogenase family protein [Acidobacteriota bacterium]
MAYSEAKIKEIVEKQRSYFQSGQTQHYAFRKEQLQKLKNAIQHHEPRLRTALAKDLGKSEYEAYVTEIGFSLYDISNTLKNLKKWMKPKKVRTPVLSQPAKSWVSRTPYGVNLLIGPFNYPVQLTLAPLTAAIAAGNTTVIKTSELTPHCSAALRDLIEETFDPEYAVYVPGEVPETTMLLKQKFDHIFFTGSPRVGSIVMQAAAKHLTPVTLELGGKSPCVVHDDANLDIAVKRVVFGKFMNAGQTCVAPDYLLVHSAILSEFQEKLKARIRTVFGEDPSQSPDYGRIVNERHFERILGLINPEKVILGGQSDRESRFIAPTVMSRVTLEDRVMSEEIFGPVLPILEYSSLDDIYTVISKLPQHPLAFYVFSSSSQIQQQLTTQVQFGGGCINHCIQHLVNHNLPFGGVGESGMGSYHGLSGFENFSHKKSVLKAATWLDLPFIYPPFEKRISLMRKLLK